MRVYPELGEQLCRGPRVEFGSGIGDRGDLSVGLGTAQSVRSWRGAVAELSACSADAQPRSLARVAEVGSVLLRGCGGLVDAFTEAVGSTMFAPHVHTQIVQKHFGEVKQFPIVQQLLRVLSPGAPVDVRDGADLEEELAYGNHSSADVHADRDTEKIISDVILGRALVFDARFVGEINGVRVSPLGVVENPKFCIIHDLTFAAGARVRSIVNDDTDFEQAPESALGHVLSDIYREYCS